MVDNLQDNLFNGPDSYIGKSLGYMDTIVGLVHNYSANISANGSVECSLNIISANTALITSPTTSDLKGVDSLHAIAQMPPGVPVACVAVGSWGASNAAFLAAQILGNKYDAIQKSYSAYRENMRNA